MTTITFISIYLLGLILTYILRRNLVRKYRNLHPINSYAGYYSWDDVIRNVIIALSSWIGFVGILIYKLNRYLKNWTEDNDIPKWL